MKNKKSDKKGCIFTGFNNSVEYWATKSAKKEVLFPKIAQKAVFSTPFL